MAAHPKRSKGRRPRLAVHKFSSCDGCQLALLNAGEDLLALADLVDIVHFAEAGVVDEAAEADIALVEGSVSTPDELERIKSVRARSHLLVPIGACAVAGGPQGLRNRADTAAWMAAVYTEPAHCPVLASATRIADHVGVDFELPGCPVNTRQLVAAVRSLLSGAAPLAENEKVCIECKRHGYPCVLVVRGEPCLGPVTATGCGALCPGLQRACYGCYGPAENTNTRSLGTWFSGLGLDGAAVARRFLHQNSAHPVFAEAASHWEGRADD
jgi:coenzyme F420-reducing hydrogenase gamma subunit